jgi:hypothetical protein
MRSYTEGQLATAVATSTSWRGVLRALGLAATSGSALRAAQVEAERVGLSSAHFTGQRRWTEDQLVRAVRDSTTWTAVRSRLGLSGGSSTAALKGHALRLHLDTEHLSRRARRAEGVPPHPSVENLSRAGTIVAAAWFELAGERVSWPLEPCRYDLLVWRGDGACRVQVKTTTQRSGTPREIRLSCTDSGRAPYDPDEIDAFFLIDGDLRCYLIPIAVVGGYLTINLSAYPEFELPALTLRVPFTG